MRSELPGHSRRVGKSYDGERPVFAEATFMIERGDKVAFAGPRKWKSTTVKAIMREIDFNGSALAGSCPDWLLCPKTCSSAHGELTVFQTIDDIV